MTGTAIGWFFLVTMFGPQLAPVGPMVTEAECWGVMATMQGAGINGHIVVPCYRGLVVVGGR